MAFYYASCKHANASLSVELFIFHSMRHTLSIWFYLRVERLERKWEKKKRRRRVKKRNALFNDEAKCKRSPIHGADQSKEQSETHPRSLWTSVGIKSFLKTSGKSSKSLENLKEPRISIFWKNIFVHSSACLALCSNVKKKMIGNLLKPIVLAIFKSMLSPLLVF